MSPENPYAAPQTLESHSAWDASPEEPRDHPQQRLAVAEGARLCLLAIWNTLGAIGVFVGGGIVLGMGGLAAVVMLGLLAVAGICHGMGLYRLLDVSPGTRTRGLIQLSLLTFLIAVVGNIVSGMSRVDGQGSLGIYFKLGQEVLSMLTYGSLTLALLRIARWYQHDGAAWSAKVALLIFVLSYGAVVMFYVAVLLPQGQDLIRSWQTPDGKRAAIVALIVWAGLVLVGVGCYARTLWKLRKMAE